tara:strand:+ start:2513 stop:2983 length:471 start_codon:yes stop_codon:yes gene_type:complete
VPVDVQFESAEEPALDAQQIEHWVEQALSVSEAGAAAATEVAVRVVDPAEMQDLNRNFRQQDKPTNVLSFPAGEVAGLPAEEQTLLGDIVICAPVLRAEAADQGKPLQDHWAHMLVHGTLHLLGYDHLDEADARKMEALEVRVLASGNIADPYRVQ